MRADRKKKKDRGKKANPAWRVRASLQATETGAVFYFIFLDGKSLGQSPAAVVANNYFFLKKRTKQRRQTRARREGRRKYCAPVKTGAPKKEGAQYFRRSFFFEVAPVARPNFLGWSCQKKRGTVVDTQPVPDIPFRSDIAAIETATPRCPGLFLAHIIFLFLFFIAFFDRRLMVGLPALGMPRVE
jgi:hypothetical protein